MVELKPCPFCGQEKYIVVLAEGYNDNRQYQIVCDASGEGGCGASCGWQDTLKEAKEAWNRRVVNRWIPVSERMPDLDEEVLAYNAIYGVIVIFAKHFNLLSVTHWMPLPPFPQENVKG